MSRINSPEYRAALAARKGKPEGVHIRDRTDGRDVVAYDSTLTEVLERIAALEDDGTGTASEEAADMTMPRPRFDRSISLGNILTIIAMIAGFIGAYTNFLATIGDQQSKIEANRTALAEVRKEADERAQKYVPTIEAVLRANEVQDTRMQNMVASMNLSRETVSDLTKTVSDLARTVGQTHEDIAILKVQLGHQVLNEQGRP